MAVTKKALEDLLKGAGLRACVYQSSPWGSKQILGTGFYVGKEGPPPAGVWCIEWKTKILSKQADQSQEKLAHMAAICRRVGLKVEEQYHSGPLKDYGPYAFWVSGSIKR